MAVIVAHTLAIVAYQLPWMQEHLDKNSLTARLVVLKYQRYENQNLFRMFKGNFKEREMCLVCYYLNIKNWA